MKKKKKVAKAPGCPPGKMWHDKTNSCIDDPGYDITVTGNKISMQEENYGPLNMLGVSSPLNNNSDMPSRFSSPFMAKSPLQNNGEGAIKSMDDLMKNVPGYNKRTGKVMQAGTVNAPMGSKAGAKLLSEAAIAASALTAPVIASGVIPDVLDKWDAFVEEKVKPNWQKVKDKVSGKSKKKYKGARGA